MADSSLTIALISEVFPSRGSELDARLAAAAKQGAELAVLPEIPLDPWLPATRDVDDGDAEPPAGPRHQRMAQAARDSSIALVGGAIVRDPSHGKRHNTALTFDASGELVDDYAKVHLPDEEGFFEPAHYEPSSRPPRPFSLLGWSIGVQLCSDNNRPTGSQMLAAAGTELIVAPRATEAASWERWKLVLRANAMTAACYVVSVNRPAPERGVNLGGPSIVIDPSGEVLVETTDALACCTIERQRVADARIGYPGYLSYPADVYREGWTL